MIHPVGKREVEVFYVDDLFKVIFDPEEGSTSCECRQHHRYISNMLAEHRCEHAARVFAIMHDREEGSCYDS